MEKTSWKVEGMTCANCALTISKFLERQGFRNVRINPISGDLSFESNNNQSLPQARKGIESLGYKVKEPVAGNKDMAHDQGHDHDHEHEVTAGFLGSDKKRFFFTLPFTLVLMMHMLRGSWHIHWLSQPLVQFFICLPVFLIGIRYFGRSAWKSVLNGMPNMNSLITIGSLASFGYSVAGLALDLGSDYIYFETTASIINLVFFGNYLEEVSVRSTQRALRTLAASQKVTANMISFDDQHREVIHTVDNSFLRTGDLILIKNGEKIPADAKVLWGEASVNESILTGESLPVQKKKKDMLIGGSLMEHGTLKAQVTAAGEKTILAGILQLVRDAQAEKPPLQKLADKISAVFVPVVIGISLITFLGNFFLIEQPVSQALLRAVAVLVIACPCAMGIATPAGIAVGLGRAARSGILFRKPSSLESFRKIEQVIFDKTGTLTTGRFVISRFHSSLKEEDFKKIVFSMEKYSSHPLGKAICREWETRDAVSWKKIEEIKGAGMKAEDEEGNIFLAGSPAMINSSSDMAEAKEHNIYITRNRELIGWIDLEDEIRPEASEVVVWLNRRKIRTIMLSGDREEKCRTIAAKLGIAEVMAEQMPEDKLKAVARLSAEKPTAMVGDGINDAPALAKATLGISLSEASQIAMQSADVVLMNTGLRNLPLAMGLGVHTHRTIRQNLFWAFIYNIIAIPVAAWGLLTPGLAALAMGFSDVVLAANSIRLFVKKVV